MSDYLNNLVARTLNLATVVQPRLPSLFESPAASGLAVSPETETTSEDLSTPAGTFQTSSAARRQPPPEQRRGSVTVEEGERADVPNSRPQLSTFETSERAEVPGVPRASPFIQAPRIAQQPDAQTATPTAPLEPRVLIRSVPPASGGEQNSQAEAARPPLQTGMVRSPMETGPAQAVRSSTIVTTAKEHGTLISTRPVPVYPASPVAEPPQTVSITIGRVDVRAVFPQPPADRGSGTKKPAAMSLDEYLKRRSEGRR